MAAGCQKKGETFFVSQEEKPALGGEALTRSSLP
jgi:hypothetical protein